MSTSSQARDVFDRMALAPELRNRIYKFALCHSENDGVIAPASEGCSEERVEEPRRFELAWLRSLGLEDVPPFDNLLGAHEPDSPPRVLDRFTHDRVVPRAEDAPGEDAIDDGEWRHRRRRRERGGRRGAGGPVLTRLSRQVREERLPLFYGSNHFHFMLGKDSQFPRDGNAGANTKSAIGDRTPRLPPVVVFAHALGDKLLRTLARFSLTSADGQGFMLVRRGEADPGVFYHDKNHRFELKQGAMRDAVALHQTAIQDPGPLVRWESRQLNVEFAQWLVQAWLCVLTIEYGLLCFEEGWRAVLSAGDVRLESQAAATEGEGAKLGDGSEGDDSEGDDPEGEEDSELGSEGCDDVVGAEVSGEAEPDGGVTQGDGKGWKSIFG
ncbi:hypothetical protein LTR53_017024 [Teratosphaeriaceae sp. CCFEE 6253]|nr:hypothetical protein LTR53_017024 [Teratosphaeriaceae sp. CCFEE 6253]